MQISTSMYKAGGSRHRNFNNMSMAAVSLDIEKPSTQHDTLAYYRNCQKLEFSISLIKLIASFFTGSKCKVLVNGDFSTPRQIAAGIHRGSVHD
jgi:hypothetical protein